MDCGDSSRPCSSDLIVRGQRFFLKISRSIFLYDVEVNFLRFRNAWFKKMKPIYLSCETQDDGRKHKIPDRLGTIGKRIRQDSLIHDNSLGTKRIQLELASGEKMDGNCAESDVRLQDLHNMRHIGRLRK